MSENKKVLHKRSVVVVNNQPKLPTSAQTEYGEIALNYADGYETMSIRNNNDKIVSFSNDNTVKSWLQEKQDLLVSGTNIKTINNLSLLGSGNINIEGGGSGITYTAGNNINIDDNYVISVTGITVPTSNTAFTNDANYVTSADTKTQVENYHYITSGDAKTQIEAYHYLTEHQSLSGVIASAEYISSAKTITFYNPDNTVIDSIDATDFIKDGMVSAVTISNDNMIITFNTDAGHEDITLSLTDIFDPDNYYSKNDIDAKHYVNSAETKSQIEGYGYTTNIGTITGINMNGVSKGSTGVIDLGTVITAETQLSTATTGNGNAITDISVNNHQITMTKGLTFTTSGDVKSQIEGYGYITGYTETDPTVPSWAKEANKPTYTASEVGALPTGTTLDNVADGTTRKLSDYTTVTDFTGHTADTTIHVTTSEKNTWNGKQDAINDLSTIRNNASSGASAYTAVTAHTGNTAIHLPTVSSTDNDKILQVVNGVWTLVMPITVYSGNDAPASSLGIDGDIYLQTS